VIAVVVLQLELFCRGFGLDWDGVRWLLVRLGTEVTKRVKLGCGKPCANVLETVSRGENLVDKHSAIHSVQSSWTSSLYSSLHFGRRPFVGPVPIPSQCADDCSRDGLHVTLPDGTRHRLRASCARGGISASRRLNAPPQYSILTLLSTDKALGVCFAEDYYEAKSQFRDHDA
jgi:hypothetical protein